MADLSKVISSTSQTSHQDAVEVVFDDEQEAMRRRRSSLVSVNDHDEGHLATECFVHSLISSHQKLVHRPNGAKVDLTIPEDEDQVHHHVQSRLLSKKQLSDMAYGIRELGKKLSHMKLKLQVQNIFILGKVHDSSVVEHTRQLVVWLLEQNPAHKVYVETNLRDDEQFDSKGILAAHPSYERRLKYWDDDLCHRAPQIFDIVLALGGDGTVLYASYLFQRIVPPVLAFALGSLGFLTKFDFEEHQQSLIRIFDEGFNVNLRLRFEGTIMRNNHNKETYGKDLVDEIVGEQANKMTHHADGTFHILNDIIVDRGPNGTMITLEVFGDNEHFTTVQADGICVATPTGSTAYNLAAGGSLCHPDNPVILLTAVCAHTLSFRPIILPDSIVLRIGVPYDARTNSWVSFDGRQRVELFPGDYVTISASRFPFPSVLPLHRTSENWIDSISRTLNWNSRTRQKSWHA